MSAPVPINPPVNALGVGVVCAVGALTVELLDAVDYIAALTKKATRVSVQLDNLCQIILL